MTQTTTKLDTLVTAATAFRSWAEMQARMDAGYVPSLYGSKNAKRLADELESRGYKVYRGR